MLNSLLPHVQTQQTNTAVSYVCFQQTTEATRRSLLTHQTTQTEHYNSAYANVVVWYHYAHHMNTGIS